MTLTQNSFISSQKYKARPCRMSETPTGIKEKMIESWTGKREKGARISINWITTRSAMTMSCRNKAIPKQYPSNDEKTIMNNCIEHLELEKICQKVQMIVLMEWLTMRITIYKILTSLQCNLRCLMLPQWLVIHEHNHCTSTPWIQRMMCWFNSWSEEHLCHIQQWSWYMGDWWWWMILNEDPIWRANLVAFDPEKNEETEMPHCYSIVMA